MSDTARLHDRRRRVEVAPGVTLAVRVHRPSATNAGRRSWRCTAWRPTPACGTASPRRLASGRPPRGRRRPARPRPLGQARRRLRLRHPDRRPAGGPRPPGLAGPRAARRRRPELGRQRGGRAGGPPPRPGGSAWSWSTAARSSCRVASPTGRPARSPWPRRRSTGRPLGRDRADGPRTPTPTGRSRASPAPSPTSRRCTDGTVRPWLSADAHHMAILRRPVGAPPLAALGRRSPCRSLVVAAEDPGRRRRALRGRQARGGRPGGAHPGTGRSARWIAGDHDLHAQYPERVGGLIDDAATGALFPSSEPA